MAVASAAINHFLFVPITIGLAFIFLRLVLACQAWTYYVFRRRVSRRNSFRLPRGPRSTARAGPQRSAQTASSGASDASIVAGTI
jgi:hypothetical protein